MQCYSELTPPTAVTHALTLPLLSARSLNLAVAKSSLLQIFTKTVSADADSSQDRSAEARSQTIQYDVQINDDDGLEASFLGGDALLLRPDRASNTKLVLVAEFPLAGTVTGLARIRTPKTKTGGDALLISFKDARLSLVEWDPERYALSTVSIHYYEQDELQSSPWEAPVSSYVNFLAADPGSRCAALKFGPRSVAILPFRQPEEDIDLADWDEELDGPRPVKDAAAAAANGSGIIEETPYAPSFVLRLPNLDPALVHPVHLDFLHEYREPTFGILSSVRAVSPILDRKDQLSYMVFTLDLRQKASTTILSVGGLPNDLFRVVALPVPVGGALLVGVNEMIHVDQSGKPNGVAVNSMTKQCTAFALADQANLGLRLEGCSISVLSPENGELLLILSDGRMAVITFRIDGRTVSGFTVRLIPPELGGTVIPSCVTSVARVGRNAVFVGSDEGDSMVVGWSRKQGQTSRRKSRIQDVGLDIDLSDEELDDDDDDDLYADEPAVVRSSEPSGGAGKGGELSFRLHDRLLSIAPIRDFTCGRPPDRSERDNKGPQSSLVLACAVGRGKAGSIAILNREIVPVIIGKFEFPEARGLWTMCVSKPIPKSLPGERGGSTVGHDYESLAQHDKFMIVAKEDVDGFESSDVYAVTAAGFESLTGTEFEPAAGFTILAGTMGHHTRIIQVLKSEVRCYDGDLGLAQILPMIDEDTGAEHRVLSASITTRYLLLIRDDSSAVVAHMNKDNELEELDRDDKTLVSTKWLAGCLYTDTSGVFASGQRAEGAESREQVVMFLLSASGSFYIYALPNLSEPVFVAGGMPYIPPILVSDFAVKRGTAKAALVEIMVADLGDTTAKSPYLILLHRNDDLTLYQPFRVQTPSSSLSQSLRFRKVENPAFAKSATASPSQNDTTNQRRRMPLRACDNIGGYSTVFLPGPSPSFIVKTAKSIPRVVGLQGAAVRALSPFHTGGCERGFIYADADGVARVSQLPDQCSFAELGVCVRKVPLDMDVDAIAFHPPSGVYAVGCGSMEPFELPRDEAHRPGWASEQLPFKPTAERGVLKLISPVNWRVIEEVAMEPSEVIMCVKTLNLEVSESTNERRQLIVVGTAVLLGEDLAVRGRLLVYDVVSVVPEPGRPETDRRLRLLAKEEVPRGPVTALSEIGNQGLMLVAQGQKCLVRGLKEDRTMLPVAFMDMNCYVTSAKELPGTGLCVMADAFKGVWFAGYTEEPYKMMLFGKSNTRVPIVTADMLPDGKDLFIIASDMDGNMHVLQFEPEHPKSLQGHGLLHRTTFCAGAHTPTASLLLPTTAPVSRSPSPGKRSKDAETRQHLLLASATGVLAAVYPLGETEYRRLSTLTAQLATSLPHAAGLNPRGYRMQAGFQPAAPAVDAGVGRSVVDGALLTRWAELASGRRADIASRIGLTSAAEVRAELEAVLGWGRMAYF